MTQWEKKATVSSLHFMHIFLEEECTNLGVLEVRLRGQIETSKKFEHEPEYTLKKKNCKEPSSALNTT